MDSSQHILGKSLEFYVFYEGWVRMESLDWERGLEEVIFI